jgi:hypothetical protein
MIIDYEKYIFKEVCPGAFRGDANGKLTFRADFRWELNVDGYIIYYPGTDFPPDRVKIEEVGHTFWLTQDHHELFAERKNDLIIK